MSKDSGATALRGFAGLVLAVLLAPYAFAQEGSALALTPSRVKEAFAWGLTAPEKELAQYELHSDVSWLVNFDTPWLRVAQFARATKIQGQNAGHEDVPAAVRAPDVQFYAHAKGEPPPTNRACVFPTWST